MNYDHYCGNMDVLNNLNYVTFKLKNLSFQIEKIVHSFSLHIH